MNVGDTTHNAPLICITETVVPIFSIYKYMFVTMIWFQLRSARAYLYPRKVREKLDLSGNFCAKWSSLNDNVVLHCLRWRCFSSSFFQNWIGRIFQTKYLSYYHKYVTDDAMRQKERSNEMISMLKLEWNEIRWKLTYVLFPLFFLFLHLLFCVLFLVFLMRAHVYVCNMHVLCSMCATKRS